MLETAGPRPSPPCPPGVPGAQRDPGLGLVSRFAVRQPVDLRPGLGWGAEQDLCWEHSTGPIGQRQGSDSIHRCLPWCLLASFPSSLTPVRWGCLGLAGLEPRPQKRAVELWRLRGCSDCQPGFLPHPPLPWQPGKAS